MTVAVDDVDVSEVTHKVHAGIHAVIDCSPMEFFLPKAKASRLLLVCLGLLT